MSPQSSIREDLSTNPLLQAVKHHPVLVELREGNVNDCSFAHMLGQWYQFLNWYPTFLSMLVNKVLRHPNAYHVAHCVSIVLDIEMGEGVVDRAYASVYARTLCGLGFLRSAITEDPRAFHTLSLFLVPSANSSIRQQLGVFYATEAVYQEINEAIWTAVKRITHISIIEEADRFSRQFSDRMRYTDAAVCSVRVHPHPNDVIDINIGATAMWDAWIQFLTSIGSIKE